MLDGRMAAPSDIVAVQKSFDVVTADADEFSDLFYQRLFADHPEVKSLFGGVDLQRQRQKLFAMMTILVSHLDRVEVVHPVLSELGRRHVAYGVTSSFYPAFVETFLAILSERGLPDWDDTLAASWRAALEQLSDVMIDAATRAEAGADAPSDDLDVLMQISGNTGVSSAHARLFTSFLAQKVHDHDLETAREVQRNLLPEVLPVPDGYEIDAVYEPAREVGGDYYDCFDVPDGRLCIAFGDVAGKGVAAALVMARLSSAIQSTVQLSPDLGAAMERVNDHMCQRAWGGRFVTLLGMLLDPVRHVVQLVNAGHRAPLLRSASGRVAEFSSSATGIPIGIVDGVSYPVAERTLDPGDTLLLFTDGIDEARSASGEFYGVERVREFVERCPHDAADLGRALLDEIHAHSAGRPASDDIAIMTIRRNA